MLVLSRKKNETITIGDDVTVTVIEIRGDKVRLGITAPRCVDVHRKEIWQKIKRQNLRSTEVAGGTDRVTEDASTEGPS